LPTPRLDVRRFRSAIRVLERELSRALRGQTASCGVTAPQCHVLLELAARQPLTVRALSEALGLDKSTLSRTLDGLARGGLVHRAEDPSDRRALGLTLTERGRRTVESIDGRCDGEYQELLRRLPSGRDADLLEAMELLGGALRASRQRVAAEPAAARGRRRR